MIAQCDSVVVLIAVEKGNKWRDSVKGLTGRLFCAARVAHGGYTMRLLAVSDGGGMGRAG